jgi:hypothetical protein
MARINRELSGVLRKFLHCLKNGFALRAEQLDCKLQNRAGNTLLNMLDKRLNL